MVVGVVIPAYNCVRFIDEAVESVLRQQGVELQVVAVDDGSTDGTAERLEQWKMRDTRLRVVLQSNAGAAAARNVGESALDDAADGVLFFDADDVAEPWMISRLVAHLSVHDEAGMAFCAFGLIDEVGNRVVDPGWWVPRLRPGRFGLSRIPDSDPPTPFFSILAGAAVLPSVSLLRRSVYRATGGWDATFGQPYEDMNLFLEMALRAEVHHVPATLVRHRRRAGQSTDDPTRTTTQHRRLLARWRDRSDLAPEEHQAVRTAFRVYDRRLVPIQGARAGWRRLRAGHPVEASRFLGGSAARALGLKQ